MTAVKVTRQHPRPEAVGHMADAALWAYALGELEFLATPEQKRVPAALAAAVRELAMRCGR